MLWLIGIGTLVITAIAYFQLNPQFGGNPTNKEQEAFKDIPNWDGEKFVNQVTTTMNINLKNMPGLLKKQFTGRKDRAPKSKIPIIPFAEERWQGSGKIKFAWYGHSVLLLQIEGTTILVDPMFGQDTSPVGPFTSKRFSEGSLEVIDQLPAVEAILITHDHYDHLDYKSIRKLKDKVKRFYVGKGVGSHLRRWGVPDEQITEFKWWEMNELLNLQLTLTPSRHFSGRGLTNRNTTLWGGWVIKSTGASVYVSGDGGYAPHFKEIGEKYGPFDVGFMECGQYNENWHQIHMYPEETVQAAIDAKVQQAIPIHWGGFTLALHTWTDPIERFTKEAARLEQKIITPEIGEIVSLEEDREWQNWWTAYN